MHRPQHHAPQHQASRGRSAKDRLAMDRIRPLEMLVRAVEAGSFSKAAAALRLTPSAISHGIAELEQRVGATLLYRTTRRLRLTEEGEAAYRCGCDILARLGDLDRLAPRGPRPLTGTLRIGIDPAARPHIVAPRLVPFMHRHPELRFEFLEQTEPQEMHLAGMDLLLRFGEPPDSRLVARLLGHVRRVPWAAPAYLEQAGAPVEPEDLRRHRCLVYKPPQLPHALDTWEFERGTERRRVTVAATLVSHGRDSLITLAVAGAGIVFTGMLDRTLVHSGALVRVLPEWDCPARLPFYALYRRAAGPLPARLAAFLDHLTQIVAELDPEGLAFIAASPPRPRARGRAAAGPRIAAPGGGC